MVPTLRIELGAEHYHCSVLPLYYVGIISSLSIGDTTAQ